jgi:hypothetical protein
MHRERFGTARLNGNRARNLRTTCFCSFFCFLISFIVNYLNPKPPTRFGISGISNSVQAGASLIEKDTSKQPGRGARRDTPGEQSKGLVHPAGVAESSPPKKIPEIRRRRSSLTTISTGKTHLPAR